MTEERLSCKNQSGVKTHA
ncbi:hypothetical protein R3I94_001409 [Phoxinus phoxinus]